MSAETAAPPALADLEAAFLALQEANRERDRIEDRRSRNRSLFGFVLLVELAGLVLGGALLIARFDPEVFKAELQGNLREAAPIVLLSARSAAQEIVPVYRREVEASLPAFLERVGAVVLRETESLRTNMGPALQNYIAGQSDEKLAAMLAAKYPRELGPKAAQAKLLATLIRSAQYEAVANLEKSELAGPYAQLQEILGTLRGLEAPSTAASENGLLGDAAWNYVEALVQEKTSADGREAAKGGK